MTDLSPEGLRALASDLAARLVHEPFAPTIVAAFTALVAEARREGATWTCPLCHCCGEKRHDGDEPCVSCETAVADARRAQRKADALAVCWFCHTARPFVDDGNTRHVGQDAQGELIEISCVAAAIRAQETP